MLDVKYGLILANDLTLLERVIEVSRAVAPFVDGIKIGITTILDEGISIIKKIKDLTEIVIADFKVADIGFWNQKKNRWEGTNAKIVEKTINIGADYIICHSIIGISSIQECVDIAHSLGGKVLTLPYMTHRGAELFFAHPIKPEHIYRVFEKYELNITENEIKKCKTTTDVIILLGEKIGVDGYIGPANNFEVLERYRELTRKEIFGPGIGRQALGDVTPNEQLKKFYEICGEKSAAIIGSAIYAAENPAEAAREFRKWRDEVVPR